MSVGYCDRCGATRDSTDNFCRRCGHSLNTRLPAVTRPAAVTRRQFLPAPLVGSLALLALGTGAEWLARRLAVSAARSASSALLSLAQRPRQRRLPQQTAVVDEILYVRKIEVRR